MGLLMGLMDKMGFFNGISNGVIMGLLMGLMDKMGFLMGLLMGLLWDY